MDGWRLDGDGCAWKKDVDRGGLWMDVDRQRIDGGWMQMEDGDGCGLKINVAVHKGWMQMDAKCEWGWM